jgi:urea transport system permease protein
LFGYVLERGFIRWFYNRPLDTLLATWGLSLMLQQAYRSIFGAQEVSVPLASWLSGAWEPTEGIQLPLNRIFIIGLTALVAVGVYVLLYRTRWGLKVRAVTQNRAMSGAVGINTRRVDALTFALGSGLAGIAGCVFTMIGSTNPGTGQLYIVDSFIVVVFRRRAEPAGHGAVGLCDRAVADHLGIPDERLDGQDHHPAAGDRGAVFPAQRPVRVEDAGLMR